MPQFPPPYSSIRTANDTFRFFEMGRGKRTVIFLHGLFGSPEHWRPIMNDLSQRFRVVALQMPVDHQPHRRRNGIHTIDELADHLETVLRQLDVPQPILCGNSLGGLVAIEFCLRHPDRVENLILSGSAGLYENNLMGKQRPRPTRDFIRTQASQILHNQDMVTDVLVEDIYSQFIDRDYVRFVLRVSRATRDRSVRDDLCKLNVPTLIIWGKNDQITPPDVAREFHQRIKNSQLVFIDECGHSPNWERPYQFRQILDEFLSHPTPNPAVALGTDQIAPLESTTSW